MADATTLHNRLIAAGIPSKGVVFGRKDAPATWRVILDASDESRRVEADAIIASFDPEAEEAKEQSIRKYRELAVLKLAKAEAEAAGDTKAQESLVASLAVLQK